MGSLAGMYWAAAACVAVPYLVYPAWLAWRVGHAARPVRRLEAEGDDSALLPSATVVIAARDEARHLARRLREFAGRIAAEGIDGEIVVVSDGSTDDTREVVRAAVDAGGPVPVRLVAFTQNQGKASALTAGVAEARNAIVVLADARQTWADDALRRLLENFADPDVGAVSGELIVESAPGVMAGVGLYWRVEKWLRKQEGALHSTVGVTGAIAAVRRDLFVPIPAGLVLDDVYWPLHVAAAGRRVVFDGRARAYDRLPDRVGAEFRRKVRTLAGNYQLVARCPWLLLPGRNPVWLPLVAHKLSRLVVPWAALVMLGTALALGGPWYGALAIAEAAALLAGLVGLVPAVGRRSRLLGAAGSFLVLNAAAWLAFWVWASGRVERSWVATRYHGPTAREPEPEPARSLQEAAR